MSDRTTAYPSHIAQAALALAGVQHPRIRGYGRASNGTAERFVESALPQFPNMKRPVKAVVVDRM